MKEFEKEAARLAADAAGVDVKEIFENLAPPPDENMGDVGFPCFTLAKKLRNAPQKIAAELAGKIQPTDRIQRITADGPYLNFTFNRESYMTETLNAVAVQSAGFGASDQGAGKTVVIDFSSPNVAKPFGVGHLRSTIIGASLGRIFEHLGFRVVGVNHIGDWGTQFGNMVAAWKRWGGEETFQGDVVKNLYELYVRFHKEAEGDEVLAGEGRKYFNLLEKGDEETRKIWRRFIDASMSEFERIYELLDVSFDHVLGESFYNDKMDAVVEKAREKGVLVESEGAMGVDLGEELGFGMMLKSDGSTVYLTRDLAAAYYRREEFGADRILYVVGAPQSHHFNQLRETLRKLGESWADGVVHVPFGHILGMSTRKGTLVFADDFIDEATTRAMKIIEEKNPDLENREEVASAVALGAIVFNDVGQRRIKDIEFDWNRMLSLEGDSGPYLQNVHVRIAGILRKHDGQAPEKADVSALTEPEEFRLAREIARFPEIIKRAADEYEPSVIASYLIDLAHAFHRFYQKHKVLQAETETLRDARLRLITAVKTVTARGLEMLGIKPIERM